MDEFPDAKRIAVVSDTHGLLRESVPPLLKGVDLIIHAGDVGNPAILTQLQTIAPLVAIRGNVDPALLPADALLSVSAHLVFVLHDLHQLDLNPATAGIRLVISGHSHQPRLFQRDGVHYLNPGSIGPRRFKLPISFATVTFTGSGLEFDFVKV